MLSHMLPQHWKAKLMLNAVEKANPTFYSLPLEPGVFAERARRPLTRPVTLV
jgi:hypothetical protein